ncbi:hypothetical protein BDQ17DRAFT_1411386 [Cyathus striatus]|nr:hypothetical protein BDQ17DRAFT_1411386 [Cyathus striatus]
MALLLSTDRKFRSRTTLPLLPYPLLISLSITLQRDQFSYNSMNSELTPERSVFLRNCISLSALVVLLYDYASTFQFEYNYIWNDAYNCNATRIFGIILESTLLILTLTKKNVETRYTNIVDKVVRDGGRFFVIMIAMSSVLILPSVQAIQAKYVTFPLVWKPTIYSILACRLIKGLLQVSTELPMDNSSASNNDVELTSFIDMELKCNLEYSLAAAGNMQDNCRYGDTPCFSTIPYELSFVQGINLIVSTGKTKGSYNK